MTASPLNLFLVDEDPVFRLGLKIWLEQQAEFAVVGEASDHDTALTTLSELQAAATRSETDAGVSDKTPAADLVMIDLGLGQGQPDQLMGLQLCSELKQQFPALAILILSGQTEPILRAAAKQMGADGFGARSLPVRELARLIEQTARPTPETAPETTSDIVLPKVLEGPIAYLNRTSVAQIDAAMTDIEQLAQDQLGYWYRLVLAGKYRELRAARWLVQRMLPVGGTTSSPSQPMPLNERMNAAGNARESFISPAALADAASRAITRQRPLVPVAVGDVRSRVCEAVFLKLQFPLENRSDVPLEIDILRSDKTRDLLYTVLRSLETLLDDLLQANILPGQLEDQQRSLLRDLWNNVTVDFFGRYYTPAADGIEQPMVVVLQQDEAIVDTAILAKIPDVTTLLAHLLFQAPIEIAGASYMATTPEALRRSQFLLENLLIQVACAVMQPVLNHYPDVETLKRSLYQRQVISTRDITRFRNELSWRYRWDELVNEPKAMFESEYRLFAMTPNGLQTHTIYAPRQTELESLSGLQYALTFALEARDAIAPRVRAAISLAGSTVVFVLTEVIGRGIGLIGRGIVKGVGNTWQDIRLRQRQRDEP